MSRARDGLGGGVQDRSTPQWLVDRIAQRFGIYFCVDLAASSHNKKCANYITESENSLAIDWEDWYKRHYDPVAGCNLAAWLNPPFGHVEPWLGKAAIECNKALKMKIVTLTLASIDSNWYRDCVQPFAQSFVLRRRVAFEGMDSPFNKALMVSLYGFGMQGLSFWDQGAAA